VSVVIHEFEVVAERPPAPAAEAPETRSVGPAESPSTPRDIERVLRRQTERTERVRAH
jgi:hypothetical protein